MDLRYVERAYPRHHLGSTRVPSFCACSKYGGACTEALKRGEPIIVVILRVRALGGGEKWLKALRWRQECYLRMLPAFRADRTLRELEDDASLAHWSEQNPFIDPRIARQIERDFITAERKQKTGGKPGRPRIYAPDIQKARTTLLNHIRMLERRRRYPPYKWNRERILDRDDKLVIRIARELKICAVV